MSYNFSFRFTLLAAALELEYHKNIAFKGKYFTKPAEEADNIYLSIPELKQIQQVDLSIKVLWTM